MKYRVLPVTDFAQNCSLVWCEQTHKAALIDPGGEKKKLLRSVEREGVELEKILLTHGHIDHVGAAKEISRELKIPIIGPHLGDAYWLELLPTEAEMFDLPPTEKLTPHQWLSDGQLVSVGNQVFNVLHCPGHTPGHVVFHQPQHHIAFVGDVIFKGSVGRTDFPGGDEQALMDSIQHKLLPLGDHVRIVSGHGAESTLGHERLTNPFLVGEDLEA